MAFAKFILKTRLIENEKLFPNVLEPPPRELEAQIQNGIFSIVPEEENVYRILIAIGTKSILLCGAILMMMTLNFD